MDHLRPFLSLGLISIVATVLVAHLSLFIAYFPGFTFYYREKRLFWEVRRILRAEARAIRRELP